MICPHRRQNPLILRLDRFYFFFNALMGGFSIFLMCLKKNNAESLFQGAGGRNHSMAVNAGGIWRAASLKPIGAV